MISGRARALVLAAVVVVVVAADGALAFRPTARFITDLAADKQLKREVQTLKVTQETTLYGLPSAPRGLLVAKRTWLLAPLHAREELEAPEGTEVRVFTPKETLVVKPGQKELVKKSGPDVVTAFLAGGAPLDRKELGERIFEELQRIGVDTDVVSYARFDGRVVYLIGSKPWEEDKAQVWIDKDSLQLLRVVTVEKQGDVVTKREVRLLGYGSPEGGSWFPKVIEEHHAGKLLRRSVTRAVEKNEALERALFQVR